MMKRPDPLLVGIECDMTRILNKKEFVQLFPEARILHEKVPGLTKTYIATNLPGV
jgi:hypothetical protein